MTIYLNDYDLANAVNIFDNLQATPNLAAGAHTLANLADWANDNSDGWAYWAKPRNASAKLAQVIDDKVRDNYRADPTDITAAGLATLYRPIRAFLTRQGVSHADIIVNPEA